MISSFHFPYRLRDKNSNYFDLLPFGYADIDAIFDVESKSSQHPWNKAAFLSSIDNQHVCVQLKKGDHICGYAVFLVLPDDVEVLLITITERYRRKGLALAILDWAVSAYTQHHFLLEVRQSNSAAQALYQRFGFKEIAIRKQYYSATTSDGRREDAVIMRKEHA